MYVRFIFLSNSKDYFFNFHHVEHFGLGTDQLERAEGSGAGFLFQIEVEKYY